MGTVRDALLPHGPLSSWHPTVRQLNRQQHVLSCSWLYGFRHC